MGFVVSFAEEVIHVIVSIFVYLVILISLPLALYQGFENFFPFLASKIDFFLNSSPYGRVFVIVIKGSFLVTLLLALLLFYFFTWFYLLPVFD